jgi:hypothetical protein
MEKRVKDLAKINNVRTVHNGLFTVLTRFFCHGPQHGLYAQTKQKAAQSIAD